MSVPPTTPVPDDAERARWHLGGLLTIRAAADDTNGSLAVVEERAVRGYATPPHVHSREDETLFVIAGELEYAFDGTVGTATAGQAVFLPRNLSHHFTVISDEAHFLVIVTPGGFERFFQQVSPPASAQRLPGAQDHPHTDPGRMVRSAAVLGTTVFARPSDSEHPVLAAAGRVGTATDPAEIALAYRAIEETVARVTQPLTHVDELVDALVDVAARRLPEGPIHARALLALGILAERTGGDLGAPVAGLLEFVGPDTQEAVALAAAYLFAHFPRQAQAVMSAFGSQVLSEKDRQRLLRCLAEPDFPSGQPVNRLGRVWPSPATWTFSETERELDRQWRATLHLDQETVRALWQAETTALLAFMGARAEHAVERSTRA